MTNKVYPLTQLRIFFSCVFVFLSFSAFCEDFKPHVDRTSSRDEALFRSRRIEKTKLTGSCSVLKTTLEKGSFFGTAFSRGGFLDAWKPWSKSDRDAIEDCDSFPCDVKLDSNEVFKLKNAEKSNRRKIFFDLVADRVAQYLKSDLRKEYEFQGSPVDPWIKMPAWEKSLGHPMDFSIPKPEKALFFRYHRFTDDSYRPIRQVFDVRQGSVKVGNVLKMTWLVRDVYTAHYFDGWGERIEITCDDEKKEIVLDQALLVEFDLYKKTDLFSRMSHKTMTAKLEALTGVYQQTERTLFFKKLKIADLPATPRPNY